VDTPSTKIESIRARREKLEPTLTSCPNLASHVSNGPTEAVNNLIKRVKRVAFGFRRFAHYRIHVLLHAGRPNWDLLATITPAWGGMPPVVRQQG
jgi:hypothetical protein